MAGLSSSNGVKREAANAAVHIQRVDRSLQFAAQNGKLTGLLSIDQGTDRLKEVCWTNDEESIVSIPLRMVMDELQKLSKNVVVNISYTRCTITPVGSDGSSGIWCPRWRVPVQHTLFPDMTRLPQPTMDDLTSIQHLALDMDVLKLMHKAAKLLGSGCMQPQFALYGEAIGVRYGDLPDFWMVIKALKGDAMRCVPPSWVLDSQNLPGTASLSSILFRQISEAEKSEQEADELAEETGKKKRKPAKSKKASQAERAGQTTLDATQAPADDLSALSDDEVYQRYCNATTEQDTARYAAEYNRRRQASNDVQPEEQAAVIVSNSQPLEWVDLSEDEDTFLFEAASVSHTDGSNFHHRISGNADIYWLSSDAEVMLAGDDQLNWTKLDEAKAFCQHREDEITKAALEETAAVLEAAANHHDDDAPEWEAMAADMDAEAQDVTTIEEPAPEPAIVTLHDQDGAPWIQLAIPGVEYVHCSLSDFATLPNLPVLAVRISDDDLRRIYAQAVSAELVGLQSIIEVELHAREAENASADTLTSTGTWFTHPEHGQCEELWGDNGHAVYFRVLHGVSAGSVFQTTREKIAEYRGVPEDEPTELPEPARN
jgi:hypothetical protein